jgi:hypothetical protein
MNKSATQHAMAVFPRQDMTSSPWFFLAHLNELQQSHIIRRLLAGQFL